MFNNPEVFDIRDDVDHSENKFEFELKLQIFPDSLIAPYIRLPHQQMYLTFVISFIALYLVGSFFLEVILALVDLFRY